MQPQPPARPKRAPKQVFLCTICGTEMYDRHCKLICPQCGYTRDCSDP